MKKVINHRLAHNGFVPIEVFPLVLGIGGQYTCLECVPRVVASDGAVLGFLLKQRVDNEQGWEKQFHIPGVAIVAKPGQDMMTAARERLERELRAIPAAARQQLSVAGVEVHDEPERNATCFTIIQTLNLTRNALEHLDAGWRFFTPEELGDGVIVDHHRRTLEWIQRPDRGSFELVDLR